jgi:hypothetical protein
VPAIFRTWRRCRASGIRPADSFPEATRVDAMHRRTSAQRTGPPGAPASRRAVKRCAAQSASATMRRAPRRSAVPCVVNTVRCGVPVGKRVPICRSIAWMVRVHPDADRLRAGGRPREMQFLCQADNGPEGGDVDVHAVNTPILWADVVADNAIQVLNRQLTWPVGLGQMITGTQGTRIKEVIDEGDRGRWCHRRNHHRIGIAGQGHRRTRADRAGANPDQQAFEEALTGIDAWRNRPCPKAPTHVDWRVN